MCWIIPLIVGVISAILGYLLGKSCCDCENSPFVTNLREENEKLNQQLTDCQESKQSLLEENETLQSSLEKAEETIRTTKASALAVPVLDKEKVKEKVNEVKGKVKGMVSHFAKTDNSTDSEFSQGKASHFATTDDTTDFHSHEAGAKTTSHFAATDNSEEFHSESKGSEVVSHFASTDSNIATEKVVAFDADLAKSVFGKKIKQNDLTVVEGIGPKIAELFNEAGIKTWAELADTSVERRQEILTAAGTRFAVHNPDTWARQAKLATEGKWQELFDWQEKLDGGVEV